MAQIIGLLEGGLKQEIVCPHGPHRNGRRWNWAESELLNYSDFECFQKIEKPKSSGYKLSFTYDNIFVQTASH